MGKKETGMLKDVGDNMDCNDKLEKCSLSQALLLRHACGQINCYPLSAVLLIYY